MIEPTLLTNTPYTFFLKLVHGPDFPGGPVVKTLPSSAGGVGSIPSQGAKILHAWWPQET